MFFMDIQSIASGYYVMKKGTQGYVFWPNCNDFFLAERRRTSPYRLSPLLAGCGHS